MREHLRLCVAIVVRNCYFSEIMSTSDGLTIVTLIVASFSMLLSSLALWPQWRHALAFLRDIVLWVTLVAIVVGAATMGWRHYRVSNRAPAAPR